MSKELTQEYLRELMRYDPDTGIFTRLVSRSSTAMKGRVAGTKNSRGYLQISIDRKLYSAHRLAWFYVYGVWPSCEIDHINRCKSDNRILNLREATGSENQQNRLKSKNNTSGYKGVFWHKTKQKWYAAILVNSKAIHLGVFKTTEEAYAAYCEAASRLHTRNPVATS